ncbi:hypothetical protein [Leuconostoc mesenteroides]|uniref:hypothetical protein n=1 Tax=Leuconostoc mesenteroides TaxID=1245 RepID=UPI0021A87CF8|nr:hypothetical protein [Leuconostoc mesenteroides]
MNRITKVITTIAATIISLDILLMVINGTMLYVLLTLAGFSWLSSSVLIKRRVAGLILVTCPIRRKLMSKLTTKSLSTTTDVNGLVAHKSIIRTIFYLGLN